MRPLSAGSHRGCETTPRRCLPLSRPESANSRPPPEPRPSHLARVEYSGVRPTSDEHEHAAAPSSRSQPSLVSPAPFTSSYLPPPPFVSWGEVEPSVPALPAKAFKTLHKAMDESAWTDEKFRRSGNPEPAEGSLCVVIEYCWNGEQPADEQLSTTHDLHRYHEEAMLTAAYIKRICPEAVVATIPTDFRSPRTGTGGRGGRGGGGAGRGGDKGMPRRLGAFEVDARMRVDGELQQHNLWSKLHTLAWPSWPAWQDVIRQALGIFKLQLRPIALLADGSEVKGGEVRLTVYNADRSKTLLSQLVPTGGSAPLKLLRGSYIVCLDETNDSYANEARLTLTKVPLPSYEEIELRVPIFIKPRLSVRLVVDPTPERAGAPPSQSPPLSHTHSTPLSIPHCSAKPSDVLLTLLDRSPPHDGEILIQQRGPASGLLSTLDLTPYSSRLTTAPPELSDQLWQIGKPQATTLVPPTCPPTSTTLASATGRGSAPLDLLHSTGCTDMWGGSEGPILGEGGIELKPPPSQGGWVVEVIASLPAFGHVALDPRLCGSRVAVAMGGAPEVKLKLCRATREVVVRLAASQASGSWCRSLPLPRMSVLASLPGGEPFLRTITQATRSTYTAHPHSSPNGERSSIYTVHSERSPQGEKDRASRSSIYTIDRYSPSPDEEVESVYARFPAGLELGETYDISAQMAEASDQSAAPLCRVSERVVVHQGEGPMLVQLHARRNCGSLSIRWVSANEGGDEWSSLLHIPEGFVYCVRHSESGTVVLSGRYEGGNELTTVPGGGILFVGETYAVEVAPGTGLEAHSVSVPIRSSEPTPVQVALRRASAVVDVRIGADLSVMEGWSSALPLPAGIAFEVWHVGLNAMVAGGHTDGEGCAVVMEEAGVYLNQRYELRVLESDLVCAAAVGFVASDSRTAVELLVSRRCVNVDVQLESSLAGSEHWAASLPPPVNVGLRVVHKALQAVALSVQSDHKGLAKLRGANSIFVGEVYTIEAIPDTRARSASCDFVARSRAERVTLRIDRTTSDVTLSVVVRKPSGRADFEQELGVPSGVRYSVWHKAVGVEVSSGYTDAVGKAVLRRKGTLFVGETYVARVAAGNGLESSSCEFVVVPQHIETTLFIKRACADLEFEFTSRLAGSNHWAASVFLPSAIPFEIRHATQDRLVYSGLHSTNGGVDLTTGVADWRHVEPKGERRAVVAPTTAPHSSWHKPTQGAWLGSAEGWPSEEALFSLTFDSRHPEEASFELVYSVAARLKEASLNGKPLDVGSGVGCAELGGESVIVARSGEGLFVAGENELAILVRGGEQAMGLYLQGFLHDGEEGRRGDGRLRSRGRLLGPLVGLYVGETYRLCVPSSELFDSSSAEFHAIQGGASCVLQLQRAFCSLDVIFKSNHAGTQHWAADLPLPTGVQFRIVHTQLGVTVVSSSTNVASRARFEAEANELLVGERYRIDLVDSELLAAASHESFLIRSRAAEVCKSVRRCCGKIEISCRSARAGTGHWSSPLPLPDGISFNIYHKKLGCIVTFGATSSSQHDSCKLEEADALFIGESYLCEVPSSVNVRASSREFKVSAEPQHIALLVERASGQATVHLQMPDSLPVPEGVLLQLTHKALGVGVLPPIAIQGERSELFGEDTLLVGQLYTLETLPHSSLVHSATEFVVLNQPFRVDLPLQRARGAVALIFRSSAPHVEGPAHGSLQWTNSLCLPAGLRYEVRHKGSSVVVASGATGEAEVCPRVYLATSQLYAGEAYILRVLPVYGVHAASCEFLVETEEEQEVNILVQRTTGQVTVSFHSIEFSSDHWAASLALPPHIHFQVVHHASGKLVHKGEAGAANTVALPSAPMFINETYTLQTVETTLVRRASHEFVVRGGAGAQEVSIPLERSVGDVQVILRSLDDRPLPLGVPFQIRHCALGCVVCEGRSTLADVQVVIDHWYVDQGALYVGEEYVLTVPAGNGFKEHSLSFVVDEKRCTLVLELSREYAHAQVVLVNSKAGSGHWSELLPLPVEMVVSVKRSSSPEWLLGSVRAHHAGLQQQLPVRLTPDIDMMAHEAYTIELQPSHQILRSSTQLSTSKGDGVASAEIPVVRAWKPAMVVELRSADVSSLPSGLQLRIFHRDLRVEVAQAGTEGSDLKVRCVVRAAEAFFIGEAYVVLVEASHGIATARRELILMQADFAGSPDITMELSRGEAEMVARVVCDSPSAGHWSLSLCMPPQQLEVMFDKQLVHSSTIAWRGGETEVSCRLSALTRLSVGNSYVVRIAESDTAHPLAVPCLASEGEGVVELAVRRKFYSLSVVLRSRDELPLPYGVKLNLMHKKLGCVVMSAICGEAETVSFEKEMEEATAAHASLSASQTAHAIEAVNSFMADHDVHFNGASEVLESVPQAWSVLHTRSELREQNQRTLDGIAAILREYDHVALEVYGQTSTAEYAPEGLADHFGLDRVLDVEKVMSLLAERRAEACRDALVERGVPHERLVVTFAGRSGAVRTDFIPCAMHNNAKLAAAATRLMQPHNQRGSVVFHAADEKGLSTATQAYTLEHSDPSLHATNRSTLEELVALMDRYPYLLLHAHVETEAPAVAPPLLLEHFRLPASGDGEVTRSAMEQLAAARARAVVEGLRSLGLHRGRVVGSCVGCAARASVTFTARTLEWQRRVLKHVDLHGGTTAAIAMPELTHVDQLGAVRSRVIFVGEMFGRDNLSYSAIHQPTTLTARMDSPHALYPGEEYILETVPMPSLGVARVARGFLMPPHDETIELWLSRPYGSVNVVLVDAKYGSNHWASTLQMPARASIRIRHHSIGLVLPETEIRGTALTAASRKHPSRRFERPVAIKMADKTHLSAAVLQYALRSRLYVGERYLLEVMESEELKANKVEFEVEHVDEQPVHVFVNRRWRDVLVHVRYAEESTVASSLVGLELVARHKWLSVQVSRGITREGGRCHLAGSDALFVGETYLLDLVNASGVSMKTTEVTIRPGSSTMSTEVRVGPATAEVSVVIENAWSETSALYQGRLALGAHVPFEVYARGEEPKLLASADEKGVCHLSRSSDFYVGHTYRIEVKKLRGVESIQQTFEVRPGEQTIRLTLKRTCGPVRAVFMMRLADDPAHWASSMPLPTPISYRVRHKALGLTVYAADIPKTATHSYQTMLPSDGLLFVDETYELEVGFQVKDEVEAAQKELAHLLRGRVLAFNDPSDINLPSIERSWSVHYLFDDIKYRDNMRVLEAVALVMGKFRSIQLEVRSESSEVRLAPARLAAHYKCDAAADVELLTGHLCSNRANACILELAARGVDRSRLSCRVVPSGVNDSTTFTPSIPGAPAFVGDAHSGLALAVTEFTVQPVAQDAVLRLSKATGDLCVCFASSRSDDPSHWSQALVVPSGVRVRVMHTQRKVEVAEGVVSGGSCFIAGAGRLFLHEQYTVMLESSAHFAGSSTSVHLRKGMQYVWLHVAWQARNVRCYLISAERHSFATEALARMRQFMAGREIKFNGAGDPGLSSVSQAWSVHHMDSDKARDNEQTLSGIASILLDYPSLKCKVHGETGDAPNAPLNLAAYLGLHHSRDVQRIMDHLATNRAEACKQALMALGVPEAQLFVTGKGRGGHIAVDFVPLDEEEAEEEGMTSGSQPEQPHRIPLPAGVPFALRHKESEKVVCIGRTRNSGALVQCPLPEDEVLFVSQQYIFEAMAGPGTEPNSVEFSINPMQVKETDALEVKLPVKHVPIGKVGVVCKLEGHGTERHEDHKSSWIESLLLPRVEYAILEATSHRQVGSGVLADTKSGVSTPLSTYGLQVDVEYQIRAVETAQIAACRASETFHLSRADKSLVLPLRRRLRMVRLEVKSRHVVASDWTKGLLLPRLFEVRVVHSSTRRVVQTIVVEECQASTYSCALDFEQMLVGEPYTLVAGCSPATQAGVARRKLETLLARSPFAFEDIWEVKPVEHAWRLSESNAQTLRKVADLFSHYPDIMLQVSCEQALPAAMEREQAQAALLLAEYYKLNPDQGQLLMAHVARNRAIACMDALLRLGVPPDRLSSEFAAHSGVTTRTSFSVRSLGEDGGEGGSTLPQEGSVGVSASIDFKVERGEDSDDAQQLVLQLARPVGSVELRLVNKHARDGHWSSCLAVPNRVPLRIFHGQNKAQGEELISTVAFDGVLTLRDDHLFVDETYRVVAPPTIRNLLSEASFVMRARGVVEVPMERAVRLVKLQLLSEKPNAEHERQMEQARARIQRFITEHDVIFNGAAEEATKTSRLGIAQAWHIDHLDQKQRELNWKTIRGIAAIMHEFPFVSVEVHGSTGDARSAPSELADFFQLDKTARVQEIMDRLAQLRAQACVQALMTLGVSEKRLWATFHGRGGKVAQKADFIPHSSRNRERYKPLPPGIPFRVLHVRRYDNNLQLVMTRVRAFMETHDVHFNGAGDEGLPSAEQAWSVDHLDPGVREANWRTLEGIAAILREFQDVRLEVRGNTGEAVFIPEQLALQLGLDQSQVEEGMAQLAQHRALACVAALATLGIERSRLFVTYEGMSGNIRTDFIPHSLLPYAPMPGGDFGACAVIIEGTTSERGHTIRVPFHAGSALYVDETYALQVSTERGNDPPTLSSTRPVRVADETFAPALTYFTANAEETDPSSEISASLELVRVERGDVAIRARSSTFGTSHWSGSLELPSGIQYSVRRVGERIKSADGMEERTVHTSTLSHAERGHVRARFPASLLLPDQVYDVVIPPTELFHGATARFEEAALGTSDLEVAISLERKSKDVTVRWAWPQGAWYSYMELPQAVPFVLRHVMSRKEVEVGVFRRSRKTLQQQVDEAIARVASLLAEQRILFFGVNDVRLPRVELAWDVGCELDPNLRRGNQLVLDQVAKIISEFPMLGFEVVGETGVVDKAHLQRMGDHFKLDPAKHAAYLSDLLAGYRAEACITELVRRGIERSRLIKSTRARSGSLATDFVPRSMEVVRQHRKEQSRRMEEQARRALLSVRRFMEDHDVVFNGARDRIRTYKLGAAQTWSIDHLDEKLRAMNYAVLDGIATIMQQHPEIDCDVVGMTRPKANSADPELAAAFGLHPVNDSSEIFLELARRRAQSCVRALVERGVASDRLIPSGSNVTEPEEREMKVDFKPRARREEGGEVPYDPVPLDLYDSPVGRLRDLITQEQYELVVAQSEEPLTFELAESCRFEVAGGEGGLQVALLIMPKVGRVSVRVDRGGVDADHWINHPMFKERSAVSSSTLSSPPLPSLEIPVEVVHRRLQTRVMEGSIIPPGGQLDGRGALFVGEEYTLIARGSQLQETKQHFSVKRTETEVWLRMSEKQPTLTLLLESVASAPLPRGIELQLCARASQTPYAAGSLPLLDLVTEGEGQLVEVVCPRPTRGALLLNMGYVIHVADGGEGGVRGVSHDFFLTEERCVVPLRLGFNAATASVMIRWVGPLEGPATLQSGDGELADTRKRAPIRVAIPYRVYHRATNEVKCKGVKSMHSEESAVGLRLVVGEEYMLVTEEVGGWCACSQPFVVGSSAVTVDLHLQRSSSSILLRLQLSVEETEQGSELPNPVGLGFLVVEDTPEPSREVVSGEFDPHGNATIPRESLRPGGSYLCKLATTTASSSRLVEITPHTHGVAEPFQARFVAAGGARVELQLRRRARSLRLCLRAARGLDRLPRLRVQVGGVRRGRVVFDGMTEANRDEVLIPASCGLFVGESYVARVMGTPTTEETSHPLTLHPGPPSATTQEEMIEIRKLRSANDWVDDLPTRPDAVGRIRSDAARLYTATHGLWVDYRTIASILGSYSAGEMQLLRREYFSTTSHELGDDLKRRSSLLKSKATKLEQLIVRSRPELDALTVRAAVSRDELTTELYEMMCTSLPPSLQELQTTYSLLFSEDAATDIQRISSPSQSSSSHPSPSSHPGPLLVGLLRGASRAAIFSTEERITPDLTSLQRAFQHHPESDLIRTVIDLFGYRTRAHLKELAVQYQRTTGTELKVKIKGHFGGQLQRSLLLLLEPADEYYAHKLHGGLFGLKRTPQIGTKEELLGSASRKMLDSVQVNRGFTHKDTVVMVVATRFGRDLSTIAQSYHRLYGKALLEQIKINCNFIFRSDLGRLLSAVIEGAMQQQGSLTASGPTTSQPISPTALR